MHRILGGFNRLPMVALTFGALACGPDLDSMVAVDHSDPGLGQRPILRLTSRPSHPLGQLDPNAARAIAAIESITEPSTDSIAELRDHLDSSVPRVREAVVDLLSVWLTRPELAEALRTESALVVLAALADVRPDIGASAEAALRSLGPVFRDALFDRAVRAEDPTVALGAARAWSTLLNPSAPIEATDARLSAAISEVTPPVAFTLVASHCESLSAGLLDRLRSAAADTAQGLAQRAAANACDLSTEVTGITADPLVAALDRDPPDDVLAQAIATVLVRVPVLPEASRPVLAASLIRYATARAAAVSVPIGAARARLEVADGYVTLAIFARGGVPDSRFAALSALSSLGERRRLSHPDLVPALERASEDSDPTVRAVVAQVAGLCEDGRVVGLLGRLARDASTDVRFQAIYAMGRVGNAKSVATLAELGITDASDRVRDAAYAALHHIVHGHDLPVPSMVSEWLTHPGDSGGKPFWGRDHLQWREYYQNR